REAEASDACAPIAPRGQVLVRVPEGAVVDRIDVQRAVVAPALVALRPAARHDRGLGDRHRPRRVGGPTARIADTGIDGRARDAVAERPVAAAVHRAAAEPAAGAVRRVAAWPREGT